MTDSQMIALSWERNEDAICETDDLWSQLVGLCPV